MKKSRYDTHIIAEVPITADFNSFYFECDFGRNDINSKMHFVGYEQTEKKLCKMFQVTNPDSIVQVSSNRFVVLGRGLYLSIYDLFDQRVKEKHQLFSSKLEDEMIFITYDQTLHQVSKNIEIKLPPQFQFQHSRLKPCKDFKLANDYFDLIVTLGTEGIQDVLTLTVEKQTLNMICISSQLQARTIPLDPLVSSEQLEQIVRDEFERYLPLLNDELKRLDQESKESELKRIRTVIGE